MTVNNPSTILLDLQNEYEHFDEKFNPEVYHRFTNRDQCLQHVSSRPINNRTLYFFIPKSEHTIISPNFISSNICYYIYCMDNESIHQMNQQYQHPRFFNSFNANALLINLEAASLLHWIDHANRTQHQPDEYDMALQASVELSQALVKELRQHIIFQTGVQPED